MRRVAGQRAVAALRVLPVTEGQAAVVPVAEPWVEAAPRAVPVAESQPVAPHKTAALGRRIQRLGEGKGHRWAARGNVLNLAERKLAPGRKAGVGPEGETT